MLPCSVVRSELKSRRPLLPPGMPMTADVKEVIATIR